MTTKGMIILLSVLISVVVGQCPRDWVDSGHNVCTQFHSQRMVRTWDEAEVFCQARGGHLASMRSQSHKDWLTREVSSRGDSFWIGLHRIDGSTWRWTDGTSTSAAGPLPWRAGYPVRIAGYDCVKMLSAGVVVGLINSRCTDETPFICQRERGDDYPCEEFWTYAGDSCYRSFAFSVPFSVASQHCSQQGAYLAWVTNPNDNTHVHDFSRSYGRDHWIGLKSDLFGTFGWTKRDVPYSFYAWAPGHPIYRPVRQNTCTIANDNMEVNASWTSASCTERKDYLCRREANVAATTIGLEVVTTVMEETTTIVAPSTVRTSIPTTYGPDITTATPLPSVSPAPCPYPDWLPRNNYCYMFNVTDFNMWPMAEFACEREGGHMISIHSFEDNDWLLDRLAATDGYLPRVWIGLLKNRRSGSYHWTDGSPLSYTNWAPGEPDSEDCVEMTACDGRWHTASCEKNKGYVCKIPVKS